MPTIDLTRSAVETLDALAESTTLLAGSRYPASTADPDITPTAAAQARSAAHLWSGLAQDLRTGASWVRNRQLVIAHLTIARDHAKAAGLFAGSPEVMADLIERKPLPVGPVTVPPAPFVIAGRPLAEYERFGPDIDTKGSRCLSHTTDMIVGYVVRETVRDGKQLHRGEPNERGIYPACGYDVFAVESTPTDGRYDRTFPIRDAYRRAKGGYAVVDSLYSCGHRSGG